MISFNKLDRYIATQTLRTFAAIMAIVMSLMTLEHLPRLFELARHSGRWSSVMAESLLGLLPEYAGIGLLVGLYLSIALLVRNLVIRSELDAIEASGISPKRWMRWPILLTVFVAGLTLWNQGWLLPDAENRLEAIGKRIAAGEFGYNLTAGQFIQLSDDTTLWFDKVDEEGQTVQGLFLRNASRVFSAEEASIALQTNGSVLLDLRNGQWIEQRAPKTGSFSALKFSTDPEIDPPQKRQISAKQLTLDTLISRNSVREMSAAYGRLLWVMLVPVAAFFGFVFGKPPRRSSSALGIFVGLLLLVVGLKMLAPLESGVASGGAGLACAIALSWLALCAVILRAEWQLGGGFTDVWITVALAKAKSLFGRKVGKTSH